ncbi:MAG: glycosyltransferase N-terminal domain-containing protein [Planctomycetota bacterium]
MLRPLDAFYALAAGATAPIWMRKARGDWGERFGKRPPLPRPERPRLMLHAVSVGEVGALRSLVPMLADECDLVLSVGTDTGIERARSLFADSCEVVRYPLDFSFAVRRFLDAVRPDAVALVELEVWPEFARMCRRRSIPVCVINGRLSRSSFRGYRRVSKALGGRVVGEMFASLEFAAVQDEIYAERFEAMGVAPNDCLITGSMKWDAAPEAPAVPSRRAIELAGELGVDRSRPLVVGGSTAPGEEALLRDATPKGVQLLCAPRRPERFDEAFEALARDGACARRSAGGPVAGAERFLLDSIGELGLAYELADVVVVGRSFTMPGGSDPIEPIALGRATLCGPGMSNFEVIRDRLVAAGGLGVCDADGLAPTIAGLIADPESRRAMAEAGRACVEASRGASRRHAELLLGLLDAAAPARGAAAPAT